MSEASGTTPTAAIALIGNELLSGKVVDENGAYLIKELRSLGVELRELRIVPDDIERVAQCVRELSDPHDYLFTTGGVGPTHDDITLEGLALAFDVELVENAAMVHHIERVFASQPEKRAAFMKLAQVPEGTNLIQTAELFWPVYNVRNVYVLPGVPEIFRRQFAAIRDRFVSQPFFLRTIYFRVGEGELASTVTEACHRFPHISIGSYPVWRHDDYRVRVTLESKERQTLEDGYRWLVDQFPADQIYKVVDGVG